jgi:hypothetical protein
VAVVVDVRLTEVLMLRVLVGQMRVRQDSMVVLVLMDGRQVFPLAHHLVGAFPAVMRDMGVLVGMDQRLVRVILEVPEVSAFRDLERQR